MPEDRSSHPSAVEPTRLDSSHTAIQSVGEDSGDRYTPRSPEWLLARIESFPKSQRFVFGQRLADRTLGVMEVLVEASYRPAGVHKAALLARANRELEVLRWLLRLGSGLPCFLLGCRCLARLAQPLR